MTALVIAGGGLAGAAAACVLARDGAKVMVLERSTGPSHKICGEFLSHEAQHYLGQLGIDPLALGGHPINRVRLVRHGEIVEAALPFRGIGLSRLVLDEALLGQAVGFGAEVRRGVTVAEMSPEIRFLATGKHDLRGARRELAQAPEDLVGFKLYLQLQPAQLAALTATVEVVLFEGGYAGLQRVERRHVNLCLLINRKRLAELGGIATLLDSLLKESPHLRTRLHGSQTLLPRPLTIARVPYGFVHRATPGETVFRLGDQACVIPSFSGDGMSMALHSAVLAARFHLAGADPVAFHRQLRRDVAPPIRRAMQLYRLGRGFIGQSVLMRMMRLWPGLLVHAAHATRVPQAALIEGEGSRT
jgi:flavin-dependent dehydrogenase